MSGDPDLGDRLVQVAERVADRAVKTGTPLRRLHFDLARALRAVPGADEAVGRDPETIFKAVVAWCRIVDAHPSDQRDVAWGENSHRDVLVQVLAAWTKVRVRGEGALAAAVAEARQAPVTVLGPLACFGPTFVMIASTAYHLQLYRAENNIFLPTRTLEAELGVHYTRVAHHLVMACTHKLLRLTQPASYQKRLAACYRFELGSRLYRPPSADAGREMSTEEAMPITGATITRDTGERLVPARDIFPPGAPARTAATRSLPTQGRLAMDRRAREPGEDDVEVPF